MPAAGLATATAARARKLGPLARAKQVRLARGTAASATTGKPVGLSPADVRGALVPIEQGGAEDQESRGWGFPPHNCPTKGAVRTAPAAMTWFMCREAARWLVNGAGRSAATRAGR